MAIKKVEISVLENNKSFKILFGKGKEQAILKPHIVDIDAFLLVQKGSILFNIEDTGQLLAKGDHVKIPKNKIHSLEVIKNCEFLVVLNSNAKMTFPKY